MDDKDNKNPAEDSLSVSQKLVKRLQGLHSSIERSDKAAADDPSPALSTAMVLEISRRYREASEIYSQVAEQHRDYPEALGRLAIAKIKEGKVEEGLVLANIIAKEHPKLKLKSLINEEPISIQTIVGDANRIAGNKAKAEEAYNLAVKIEPADAHSLSMLSELKLTSDDPKAALDYLDRLTKLRPTSPLVAELKLLHKSPTNLPAILGRVAAARDLPCI